MTMMPNRLAIRIALSTPPAAPEEAVADETGQARASVSPHY